MATTKKLEEIELLAKENAAEIIKCAQDIEDTQGLDSTLIQKMQDLLLKAAKLNDRHNTLAD